MALVGLLLVAAVVLVTLAFVLPGPRVTADARTATAEATGAAAPASVPASVAATPPEPVADATAAPTYATVISTDPKPAPAPAPVVKPRVSAAAVTPLDAYRGLGSWVDIYDDRAWKDPAAAIRDMAKHGVRTLYIETSNSRSSFAVKDPAKLSTFIREAHAHKMRIVAWYLPDMTRASTDYARIAQAIGFHTSDGQKFDSFALDIESSAIASVPARNAALSSLSGKIRKLVGKSYPLGAIIPSPAGLAKKAGYWDAFPYTSIAGTYDVFVPMGYYTYHGKTYASAYADALACVRILRAQKGCSKTPIHLIGGIAENSSTGQVQAFVRASRETKIFGASLYGWAGTTSADWQALKAITP